MKIVLLASKEFLGKSAWLHHVFTSEEYGIERVDRGIPALRRAHQAIARRDPRISLLGDEFRLELYGV